MWDWIKSAAGMAWDWAVANKGKIIAVGAPLAAAAATGGLGWTDAGQAFVKAILPLLGLGG